MHRNCTELFGSLFFSLVIAVSNYALNGIKINYISALFYISVLLLLHSVPVLPEASPSCSVDSPS